MYARSQAALLLAVDPEATSGDLNRALDLLGDPADSHATRATATEEREAWTVVAQALLRSGRDSEVSSILESVDLGEHHKWLLTTDLANPARTGDTSADTAQRFLNTFNRVFAANGLEGVTLTPPAGNDEAADPFASVRSVPYEQVSGDDLITVVMSAFRPAQELRTAVRSICDQSWQAWELLIVDDDSGAEYQDLLEEVAAGDERIRLIHAPVNSGTYPARNLALAEARGRYVTFQDSDDWSHPRRLERQVRALQEHPRLLADRSWAIRAYPDMTLTFPGYPARRLNASSLMLNRERTLDLVGDFDHIRVSADVELPKRMLAAQPRSVLDRSRWGHLAITLLRQGSLSRADAFPGWTRWSRVAYRDAYEEWHGRIRTGRASSRYQHGELRPFALPDQRWLPDRGANPAPAPEIVVLGDLRQSHPRARATAELARALSSSGRIGLAHAETPYPLASRRSSVHISAQEQLNNGAAQYAHLSNPDHSPLLVVTEPAVLLHAAELRATFDNVLLRGDHWNRDPTWTVAAVSTRASELSSTAPIWALPTAEARDAFQAAHPDAEVWLDPLPWAIDADRLKIAASQRSDNYLVVGHHLAAAAGAESPTPEEVRAALPAGHGLDVRLLASGTAIAELLGRTTLPPGWVDLGATGSTVIEFLGQLDAFVHLGPWSEDIEVGVLEALAANLSVSLAVPPSAIPADLEAIVRTFTAATLGKALLEGELAVPGISGYEVVQLRTSAWKTAINRISSCQPRTPNDMGEHR